jgi:tetratricopeptide (TPR) repeat protein
MPQKTSLLFGILIASLLMVTPPSWSQEEPYLKGVSKSVIDAVNHAYDVGTKGNKAQEEKELLAVLTKVSSGKIISRADQALVNDLLYRFYTKQKLPEKALPYANGRLNADRWRFGKTSIFVAEDLKDIGELQQATNQTESAIKTYEEALKIAEVASSAEYFPCIVAAYANSDRKEKLVKSCREGIATAHSKPGREEQSEAYFKSSIAEVMASKDYVDKADRAHLLFKGYRDFLQNTNQTEKLEKFEEEVKEYERKMGALKEYSGLPVD